MTVREELFFKNLIIDSADKERIAKSLKSKGVEKHILIKNKLLAWSASEEIKYSQIASTYRYDKRIRYVLFKYISYLEEFYRSIILDNYINDINQTFWLGKLKNYIQQYQNLNEALEHLDFSTLINQCMKLPIALQNSCFFSDTHLKANISALIELRNAVMHNKFLLLYRGFKQCYVKGVDNSKSANLKANILNLIQFLPTEVRLQCVKGVNDCQQNRNNKNDTEWDLPQQVIISVQDYLNSDGLCHI